MHDPLVGHALEGRYEITRRIARGGMATVYVATDLRLTRTVAVKVMHVGLGDDEDFARKFDREARASARLCHPNVVSVFDQGIDDGRPFIVMEYVEGRTLRSLMRHERVNPTDGGMDPVRALTIMEAVLCALAAAHESGLVHRDVKPENVLISDHHQIKVADFGLAKAVSAQTATATAGILLGTVSYLPPELVTSGKATLRSDVYSAGIVLYELLTGRKPYTGDTPIQVAYAHVHNTVPAPSEVNPDIPDYLDALVRHATAREPKARPADARVMLHELRAVRARLRSGATADSELTEIIETGASDDIPDEDSETGIRMRRSFLPDDYNPRTSLSPSRHTPTSPTSPTRSRWTAVAPPPRSARTPQDAFATIIDDGTDEHDPYVDDTEDEASDGVLERRRDRRELRRREQARRRRRGVLALLLVLVLAGGAAISGWWVVTNRPIAVPRVANLDQDQASTALADARLEVTLGDREFSETVPKGKVIRTDPEAGAELPPGSPVTLVVSRGPERYEVPPLVGEKLTDVKAALTANKLKLGKVTEVWDEKVAKGVVIKASGKPGDKVRRGTTIDLTVSKGREPIEIADWTGKSAAEAKQALEKLGFTVKITQENHDSVESGKVIRQDPGKGTGHRGDTVTLVESKGPVMVTVPNIRNMKVDEAEALLKKAGFVVKKSQVVPLAPLGIAHRTDPEGGTKARKGATITLYYV
ncbi:MAG TPA: Stk1 family PASTA domain-containing Ser/Thr kinase [Candidatus Avipropionibacterium avicola]|uniref:non-specific serine/threonine protein kinase n=1 Tax=Candidatus Avipropionibacterium avicola TaxID=2840701 RepID=A0A9D1KN75_9ACTN|nr:Stk1 family PASTA domain-containing Ser/Thr kinase [Candidatus Avipropionibacterium avicola]